MKLKLRLLLAMGIGSAIFSVLAAGQAYERKSPMLAYARDRVVRPIDDAQRVVLPRNRHPLARPELRLKPVSSDFPLERTLLGLTPDAAQQDQLDDHVDQQRDPNPAQYHN